jgi:hypothetical protein
VPQLLPQHLSWHCDAHARSLWQEPTARTIINTQVLLFALAVASMDHRDIDGVLKDMRQHPVAAR